MAFTYGFYNSLNGDRKYNAFQMSTLFDGIIVDGVFETIGQHFAVTAGSGMSVNVGTGRAWFNHTWNENDSVMPLNLPASDLNRSRYDAVVIEVGDPNTDRTNTIKIVSGEAAVNPSKPVLNRGSLNNDIVAPSPTTDPPYQHALAYILVPPAAESISAADIEIVVGKDETPFVTGPLETRSIEELFNQWDAQFSAWFANLKAQLTDNVVTNLQNQIDQNRAEIRQLESMFEIKNIVHTEIVTASKTWKNETGKELNVEVICFGGGGGVTNGSSAYGGGGGGHRAAGNVTLSAGQSVAITIGSGGTAGNAGGTTSFGTYLSANGGNAATSSAGGAGGSGGGGGDNGSGGSASYGGGGGSGGITTGSSNYPFAGKAGGSGGTYGGGGGGGGSVLANGFTSQDTTVFAGGTGGARGSNGGAGGTGGGCTVSYSYVDDSTSPWVISATTPTAASAGRNTSGTSLEFKGTGSAGSSGTNYLPTTRGKTFAGGGGGGGGGYGGSGGNGISGAYYSKYIMSGAGGGGGGYGANGGNGRAASPSSGNHYSGAGGGGGGWGGKGGDAGYSGTGYGAGGANTNSSSNYGGGGGGGYGTAPVSVWGQLTGNPGVVILHWTTKEVIVS